jgi:hypothetical protein
MTVHRSTLRSSGAATWALLAALAIGVWGSSAEAGAEFQVNATTAGHQQTPSVALDGSGNSVMVWDSIGQDGSLDGVYGRRFAANGTAQGDEFHVSTFTLNRQFLPAVARMSSGAFVVVWDSDYQARTGIDIYAQRYAADGTPQGGEIHINDTTQEVQPTVSVGIDASGNFTVVWAEQYGITSPVTRWIRARQFNADGTPKAASFIVRAQDDAPPIKAPVIAMNGDGSFVLTWLERGPPDQVVAQRYNANGTPAGSLFTVNTANSAVSTIDYPRVAAAGSGNFVIVWETFTDTLASAGVYGQRYAATGIALGGNFLIGSTATMQYRPRVAMSSSGAFVVVASSDAIYACRYNPDGTANGGVFRVDSSPTTHTLLYPDVGMNAIGNAVMVWQNWQQDGNGRGIFAKGFGFGVP